MSSLEQEELELEQAELIYTTDMGEALLRLEANPDFKKIIVEGYLDKGVQDSVSLLAVPAIIQRGERPAVIEDLIAASNLKFFLYTMRNSYTDMIEAVREAEEAALEDSIGEEVTH